jgi:hypothetical protein
VIKKKMATPATMFAMENHGKINGLVRKAEMTVQSKVIGISPSPVKPPKIWLTTTLFGAIQVAKTKKLRN